MLRKKKLIVEHMYFLLCVYSTLLLLIVVPVLYAQRVLAIFFLWLFFFPFNRMIDTIFAYVSMRMCVCV